MHGSYVVDSIPTNLASQLQFFFYTIRTNTPNPASFTTLVILRSQGRPCSDTHGKGSRLGQGERSTKTILPTPRVPIPAAHHLINTLTVSIEETVSLGQGERGPDRDSSFFLPHELVAHITHASTYYQRFRWTTLL